jgi:hypothetical protein
MRIDRIWAALAVAVGVSAVGCRPERAAMQDSLDGFVPRDTAPEGPASSEEVDTSSRIEVDSIVAGVALRSLSPPDLTGLEPGAVHAVRHLLAAVAEAGRVETQGSGDDEERLARFLEAVVGAGDAVPRGLRDKIEPYARRVFLRRAAGLPLACPSPGFIPGELAAAAERALLTGQDSELLSSVEVPPGSTRLERLEALLSKVRPLVFDCQRLRDADTDTGLMAPLQRGANPSARAGRLATLIESAAQGLGSSTAAYLRSVAQALKGSASAEPSKPLWSRSEGPVEVFVDWEVQDGEVAQLCLIVARRHDARSASATALGAKLGALEQDMPWLERLKRPLSEAFPRRIVVADVIAAHCPALGDTGGAIAWPAYPAGAPSPGKLLYLDNVAAALTPAADRRSLCAARARAILGEGLGAPAGKASHLVKGRPGDLLGELEPFVESLRRNLVAAQLALEPGLVVNAIFDEPSCAAAVLERLLVRESNAVCGRARSEHESLGLRLLRNRLEVAGALGDPTGDAGAVSLAQDKARAAVSILLAEAQRVASAGDRLAALRLHAEASATVPFVERGALPPCAFVMPEVQEIKAADGALTGLALRESSDILSPGRF